MTDTNSHARLDVLYTKHFLDDDYEDILFYMNWAFYQCFAAGAYAHISILENQHRELKSLYAKKSER